MTTQEFTAHSLNDLIPIADYILATERKKIALYGNLGAGKTALVKILCQRLEVSDTPTSPTFSLVNSYHSPKGEVYHLDLYRLKNVEEALSIGVLDILDNALYCFIEWAELLEPFLPETLLRVYIQADKDENRQVKIIF